jgi:hypothetical protein
MPVVLSPVRCEQTMRMNAENPAGSSCRPRYLIAADLKSGASQQGGGRTAQEKDDIDERSSI